MRAYVALAPPIQTKGLMDLERERIRGKGLWARWVDRRARRRGRKKAYMIFLGLMIKHQRVQIRPVHVRATFWVMESFSAGR